MGLFLPVSCVARSSDDFVTGAGPIPEALGYRRKFVPRMKRKKTGEHRRRFAIFGVILGPILALKYPRWGGYCGLWAVHYDCFFHRQLFVLFWAI